MFRKMLFACMAAVLLSTIAVGPVFAGQDKVTVCHKPGTEDEATLTVAAPAEAAHLGHGDYSGPCRAPQSSGCDALNALVPDPQTETWMYYYAVSNLEFYPGEMIHVDTTITIDNIEYNDNYLTVAVIDNAYDALDVESILSAAPGETVTGSADYTVVAGDNAAGIYIDTMALESFTVDAVNFSCTAAQ